MTVFIGGNDKLKFEIPVAFFCRSGYNRENKIYGGTTMENNNEILNEEEQNILTLTDENGNETAFEYLDVIEYKGEEYLILMPAEEESDEIVILLIEPVDEENENYLAVEDEATLMAVYEIFKERYKDVLTFAD
jgi:uncharacterized protein YrzB (UPF0473 family)